MSDKHHTQHLHQPPHDHEHGHAHSHATTVTSDNEHKVLWSFLLIFGYMIVEVIGGIYSGSLALLADAGHMLTDTAALGLSYLAFRFGRHAPDNKRSFGYMRFEVIAGFLNALTLMVIVVWIIYEAWQRLQHPQQVLSGSMLIVAVVGLLVNIAVFWVLTRGDREHVNIKGAILHVMGDLLGSVGAIIAAVVIYFTRWMPIDPILSVVVSLLVLRSAWGLLTKSLHILLEGTPDNVTSEKIQDYIQQHIPDVLKVYHIHVWSITSGRNLATLHIRLTDNSRAAEVTRQIEHELAEQFAIEHATVAVDWDEEEDICCELAEPDAAAEHHPHQHEKETH